MDASSEQWIAELGMMEQLEQYSNASLSPGSFSCTTDYLISENGISFERPMKLAKRTNSFDFSSDDNKQNVCPQSSMPHLLFESEGLKVKQPKVEMDYGLIINDVPNDECFGVKENRGCCNKRFRSMGSNPNLLSQDHAIAERKRREKLGGRFSALSAFIPGLKKMDKATVLGDAVRYMKQLQEQIKTLEDQVKQRQFDSAVLVKKYCLSMDEDEEDDDENKDANSSSSNRENPINFNGQEDEEFPIIEARVMDNKDVLIRVHSERQHELPGKILSEMEKLHLSVTSSSSMAFGDYGLVVTMMAEMETNFSIRAKDIASKLGKLL